MEFSYQIQQITAAAKWLKHQTEDQKVICFKGDMGAGKTTFIKAFCKELGVNEPMNSPSFGIVNEYQGDNQVCIYHFDLYRIKNEQELYDIGFEEYLQSGNTCLIEWPEIANVFLQKVNLAIIEIQGTDNERTLQLYFHHSMDF